jgi:hypothetical protein
VRQEKPCSLISALSPPLLPRSLALALQLVDRGASVVAECLEGLRCFNAHERAIAHLSRTVLDGRLTQRLPHALRVQCAYPRAFLVRRYPSSPIPLCANTSSRSRTISPAS